MLKKCVQKFSKNTNSKKSNVVLVAFQIVTSRSNRNLEFYFFAGQCHVFQALPSLFRSHWGDIVALKPYVGSGKLFSWSGSHVIWTTYVKNVIK